MTATTPTPLIKGVSTRRTQGREVHSVADPHALIQIIGWMKFTGRRSGQVVYRGQSRVYDHLSPSGLRGKKKVGHERHQWQMKEYIDQLFGSGCRCRPRTFSYRDGHLCGERLSRAAAKSAFLLPGTWRATVEPLLQHYGIKTRWLDVVDNVWIALWFACYDQYTEGSHAYHKKRSISQEGPDAKAYILVLDTGPLTSTPIPGYWIGETSRVVDLRYAAPSNYLRPHAQHGLLIAPPRSDYEDSPHTELDRTIRGIIELNLHDALEWLGSGTMTSAFSLFPPAIRDEGFLRLLSAPRSAYEPLGAITTYGPSNG